MKISELKDQEGNVNLDVKIIWSKAPLEEKFGKKIKSVIVADIDSKEGDPTAYLDLYNDDTVYGAGDQIRVIDAYSKLIKNKTGQFRITNAKKVEKLESQPIEAKPKEKNKKATQKLIDKFDGLYEKYQAEDIDVEMLKKGLNDVVDSWSE